MLDYIADMEALGRAMVVGGAAFLCSGLIFLLPTKRKVSEAGQSLLPTSY